MKNVVRSIVAAAGFALLISAAHGFLAKDYWPQWRGPNRDGKAADFKAPKTWPKELTQVWTASVGAGVSSPALVGGKVYVFARQGGDEVIECLNAADGKPVWQEKYPAPVIAGPDATAFGGARSSPTVADGKIVTLGVTGILSCWDADSHKLLWRKDEIKSVPRFHTSMSPIVVDGKVIAQLGGPGAGVAVAYDLTSGAQKWKWDGEGPGYASPVAMTVDDVEQIVALTDKSVVGLGVADGKLLWQVPFAPQGMAYNAATPIVDGQTVIVTGSGRGTKALKIEKKGDSFAATEVWSNPQIAPQFSTPVLKDGLLFGISDQGSLFCLSAKDGKTAWTQPAKLGKYGAMIDAGPVVMALPESGELIVFKPSAEKYEEVARIKAAATKTYAYPAIVGQRIFVKDQDSLTMSKFE